MPHIRLSEPDRQRLGCPELLDIDVFSVTNREAVAIRSLDARFATPRLWRKALKATPLYDDGLPADDDAVPDDYVLDYAAWTAMVWVALRRAGIDVDIETLEFDAERIGYLPDDDTAPKDPDETTAQPPGVSSGSTS